MPSFITLPASKISALVKAKIAQVEECNKKGLAVEGVGGIYDPQHTLSIASDFVNALEYVDPSSSVLVDIHEFKFLI